MKRPKLIEKPDFSEVIKQAKSYADDIEQFKENAHQESYLHEIFEKVMCAVYGDKYFEWENNQDD